MPIMNFKVNCAGGMYAFQNKLSNCIFRFVFNDENLTG